MQYTASFLQADGCYDRKRAVRAFIAALVAYHTAPAMLTPKPTTFHLA